MFEFSVIRKYLVPRWGQLSVSLIALMSVLVISLVVCLFFLFLSITEGIEKAWLERLTTLNAPIRISPTDDYYRSYYYRIDEFAYISDYTAKNIREKKEAKNSNPYDPEVDEILPSYFPRPLFDDQKQFIDPVQRAFSIIESYKDDIPSLSAKDYEIAGAMLRIRLIHPESHQQSFLTQATYVSTFPEKGIQFSKLLLPTDIRDIDHLLYLTEHPTENSTADDPLLSFSSPSTLSAALLPILSHLSIKEICSSWIPRELLPENVPMTGFLTSQGPVLSETSISGTFQRKGSSLIFCPEGENNTIDIAPFYPIQLDRPITCTAHLKYSPSSHLQQLKDLKFLIQGHLQRISIEGLIPWENIEIKQADAKTHFSSLPPVPPPWVHSADSEIYLRNEGIILPKNFRDSGVRMGDHAFLSYGAFSTSSLQEQRIPVFVAGFYDPGVISVGARPIFANEHIVQTIHASSHALSVDPLMANGIQLWFEDLSITKTLAAELKQSFEKAGIDRFWNITTFYEYDFAIDLLKQFQSDRYLFTLIGIIILIVACTNIISLLLLLVNAKKKEIGILQTLGAKKSSIALIFGMCGAFLGLLSCCIGLPLGLITLHYLEHIVHVLSILQGHEAFNTAFYGSQLPNTPSEKALWLIFITTPIISLMAGLVPAIKACRIVPANTLRSE